MYLNYPVYCSKTEAKVYIYVNENQSPANNIGKKLMKHLVQTHEMLKISPLPRNKLECNIVWFFNLVINITRVEGA